MKTIFFILFIYFVVDVVSTYYVCTALKYYVYSPWNVKLYYNTTFSKLQQSFFYINNSKYIVWKYLYIGSFAFK